MSRKPSFSSRAEIDVHGMTCVQAQAAVDAGLRRSAGLYRITVIHGYSRGTVIRDFIRSHYRNDPRVIRVEIGLNPGVTDLVLKEY